MNRNKSLRVAAKSHKPFPEETRKLRKQGACRRAFRKYFAAFARTGALNTVDAPEIGHIGDKTMKPNRETGRHITAILLIACLVLAGGPAIAQLGSAKDTEVQNVEDGAAAQNAIDQLDDEREQLLQDYRVQLQKLDSLREYNAQLRTLIDSQQTEMTSIRDQIERVTGVERDIVPVMNQMLSSLEQFVQLDLPFFARERRERIASLKDMMNRADVTNAEKYRRILEAYQIENDYGRTIEAKDGKLTLGDKTKTVTFLKVGRIAYLYQTLDGNATYAWDQTAGGWTRLSGKFDGPTTTAIRMAREQVPPGMIYVPLKAPREAAQ